VLPFWLGGRDWSVIPPLLSARWRRDDGGHSTWITPLFHYSSDDAGAVTNWHALNVIHSGDSDAVLPLYWTSGPPESRQRWVFPLYFQSPGQVLVPPLFYWSRQADGVRSGLVPFWFAGPDWWVSPLGLSAGWRKGDRSSTWFTPLFHWDTVGNQTSSLHLLTYFQTPDFQTVAPLWWNWRTNAGGESQLFAPLWYQLRRADGDFTAAALPLLFSYHRGAELDTSTANQLFPFLVQNADQGYEVNVLWRLFHLRSWKDSTEVMVAPLWWSDHREHEPMSWQILGGLLGRDCNRSRHTSLSYALYGLLRFGDYTPYEAAVPATP